MAIHTELPIYKVAYDLLGIIAGLVKNMHRDYKRSIGEKISTGDRLEFRRDQVRAAQRVLESVYGTGADHQWFTLYPDSPTPCSLLIAPGVPMSVETEFEVGDGDGDGEAGILDEARAESAAALEAVQQLAMRHLGLLKDQLILDHRPQVVLDMAKLSQLSTRELEQLDAITKKLGAAPGAT